MTVRRSGKSKNPVGATGTGRKTPLGTDAVVGVKTQAGRDLTISFWDLWMVLAAHEECGGGLDKLAAELRARREKGSFGREEMTGKLSHLRDLQRRLREAGVDEAAVLAAAGPLADSETRRARIKVLEKPSRQAERSEAMERTPEDRGREFALRGLWDRFRVSPAPFAAEIAARFKTRGFYSEEQSHSVADRLDRYVDRGKSLAARSRHGQALARFRAVLTETIEVLAYADDSYGAIGDAFQDAFQQYLELPVDRTGIEEPVFLRDLLSLLIWEDYGLTSGETHGYFAKRSREQGQFSIDFLRSQIGLLAADDLDYQAEKALTLLGQVAWEQRRYEMFEALAREMGSRHWERILRLADAALKGRKRDLAFRVFDEALQPGMHLDFLRSHHARLKRGAWKPEFRGWGPHKRWQRPDGHNPDHLGHLSDCRSVWKCAGGEEVEAQLDEAHRRSQESTGTKVLKAVAIGAAAGLGGRVPRLAVRRRVVRQPPGPSTTRAPSGATTRPSKCPRRARLEECDPEVVPRPRRLRNRILSSLLGPYAGWSAVS